MPRSMTAYGRGEAEAGGYRCLVEIRSLNHRSMDLQVRLPRELFPLEEKVRDHLQRELARGRVEFFAYLLEVPDEAVRVEVDCSLARAYRDAFSTLEANLSLNPCEVTALDLARFSDVVVRSREGVDVDAAWEPLERGLERALKQLVEAREREAKRLVSDFYPRLDVIRSLTAQVEERSPAVVENHRHKLWKKMTEIVPEGEMDEQRLYQEAALFAERSDISEEIVRLKSHLQEFSEALQAEGAVGRRLDFILQEMLREINTIASKGNDAAIARDTVEMKSELEKIREQVQNLE